MIRAIVVLILIAFASAAFAKPHHHAHRRHHVAPVAAASWLPPASNLAAIAQRYIGGNPTGWARVWCAQFLNAFVLPAAGYKGSGSATAASFRHWGVPASPQPGAIAVVGHHHVTVALRINGDGTFEGVGGNQGHRVSVERFGVAAVTAWRLP